MPFVSDGGQREEERRGERTLVGVAVAHVAAPAEDALACEGADQVRVSEDVPGITVSPTT